LPRKSENKLIEAGVIGGSAKQEFLGVHFFTNLPTKTDNRTPATSPLILLKKVLPAHPPLLALKLFFPFPTTNRPLWSGLEFNKNSSNTFLPAQKGTSLLPSPPLLALKSFFPPP